MILQVAACCDPCDELCSSDQSDPGHGRVAQLSQTVDFYQVGAPSHPCQTLAIPVLD